MADVKKSKVLIVLGMHRSGTSAITRGLQVMGVELGNRLIPPIEGNNDKGFWEDIDLNAFDNEILAELGQSWFSLTAIDQSDIGILKKRGYFLRAVELLRSKIGEAEVFGFKDPRVAKLLPFWTEVFEHCELDVSYVVALRHPMSVAQSLVKRDGMDIEQSYLLWLGHIIPALAQSAGKPRIVTDYDRIMAAPEQELQRVANAFGLQLSADAMADYRNEFLDPNLRHTVYALDDLLIDGRCPPLVYEVYSVLNELAHGRRSFDEAGLDQQIGRWHQEFERMNVAMQLADRLAVREQAALAGGRQSDDEIAALRQRGAELQGTVAAFEKRCADYDQRCMEMEHAMVAQSAHIMHLEQHTQARADEYQALAAAQQSLTLEHQALALEHQVQTEAHQARLLELAQKAGSAGDDLERSISALKHEIHCQQCHIEELEKAAGSATQRADALEAEQIALRSEHAAVLADNLAMKGHIERLYASSSWRVTAPLRKIGAVPRAGGRALFGAAMASYRALPVSPSSKQKLKDGVFKYLGFAFKRVPAYQRWMEYQEIQHHWAVPNADVPGARLPVLAPPGAALNPPLPVADGVWEWQDYAPIKANIAQVKASRLANAEVTPCDMIRIAPGDLRQAAEALDLPPLLASPDVSIILPVFNNIALTLECLASIAKHAEPAHTFEVIVADDCSTDETEQLLALVKNIRYSRGDSNLGFLRNCNRVLGEVTGRYVLYLNNDVQVTAGWLGALLATFALKPNAGAVGPRFVYPSGHLQEAGVAFTPDGAAAMVGLNENPALPRYSYLRRVDYVSGACLLLPTELARKIGGFSEEFLPCYCEDADLCLSVRDAGFDIYYNPAATIIHHLSQTTAKSDDSFKMRAINANLGTLRRKWSTTLDSQMDPRLIAFFLPQFHPIPENDQWWGKGFTEWTNVSKAQPNFVGHYQPRVPADLGYYDLRLIEVMKQQAELAQRYGVHGFCYYYYWFDGHRLLERPVEQLLLSDDPKLPFCLCWANENWSRRWDGQEHEVLMAQSHSVDDDIAVISDLIRFFKDQRYIRIDGKPLLLIYRITLFPDFAATAERWRTVCREQGIGEIYLAMVESFEMVHANAHPSKYGCDAAVEFPPQGLAEQKAPSGEILNPAFAGSVADYRDLAVRYATREAPAYTRFKGVMPGWDNTARRGGNSFCFEHATPGAFQGWLEETIDETRKQHYGDERLVFVNAWNEWAEGAYLEPDRRFGHSYLEAVRNAREAGRLLARK